MVIGSGIISSGVDNRGDVDVDTPPKPFMRLFVRFSDADEVERTNMLFPFGKLLSTWIKFVLSHLYVRHRLQECY